MKPPSVVRSHIQTWVEHVLGVASTAEHMVLRCLPGMLHVLALKRHGIVCWWRPLTAHQVSQHAEIVQHSILSRQAALCQGMCSCPAAYCPRVCMLVPGTTCLCLAQPTGMMGSEDSPISLQVQRLPPSSHAPAMLLHAV